MLKQMICKNCGKRINEFHQEICENCGIMIKIPKEDMLDLPPGVIRHMGPSKITKIRYIKRIRMKKKLLLLGIFFLIFVLIISIPLILIPGWRI